MRSILSDPVRKPCDVLIRDGQHAMRRPWESVAMKRLAQAPRRHIRQYYTWRGFNSRPATFRVNTWLCWHAKVKSISQHAYHSFVSPAKPLFVFFTHTLETKGRICEVMVSRSVSSRRLIVTQSKTDTKLNEEPNIFEMLISLGCLCCVTNEVILSGR